MVGLDGVITQKVFGELVGISQQAVSDLVDRGVIVRGDKATSWLLDYCENLREVAAGRASGGDLDLVQERARLAKEQADERMMKNAVTRREYAPLVALEMAAADAGRQISEILQSIPVQINRRCPNLNGSEIELIEAEIVKARNIAANLKIDLDTVYGESTNSDGDESWSEDVGSTNA